MSCRLSTPFCKLILLFLLLNLLVQPVISVKVGRNKSAKHEKQISNPEIMIEEANQASETANINEEIENEEVIASAEAEDSQKVFRKKDIQKGKTQWAVIALVQKHASILKSLYFDFYDKFTNKVSQNSSSAIIILFLSTLVILCAIKYTTKWTTPTPISKAALPNYLKQQEREKDEQFYAAYAHNLSCSGEKPNGEGDSILTESDYKLERDQLDILNVFQKRPMSHTFPVLKLNDENDSLVLDQNSEDMREILENGKINSFMNSYASGSITHQENSLF